VKTSTSHANIAGHGHFGKTKCQRMYLVNALNVFEMNVLTQMSFDNTSVQVIFEFDSLNIVSSATHNEK